MLNHFYQLPGVFKILKFKFWIWIYFWTYFWPFSDSESQKQQNGFFSKLLIFYCFFIVLEFEVSRYITDVLACFTTLIDSMGYLEMKFCIWTYFWACFWPIMGSEGKETVIFFKPFSIVFTEKLHNLANFISNLLLGAKIHPLKLFSTSFDTLGYCKTH